MRALAVGLFLLFVVSGCAGSGPKQTTQYTTTPETTAGTSPASPRAQQIALARASSSLFIFPAEPGEKKCAIPEGGVHVHFAALRGTCTTRIRAWRTHEPSWVVTFTEAWEFRCPMKDDCVSVSAHLYRHMWRVTETEPMVTPGARPRIAATRQSGATAPQYYK